MHLMRYKKNGKQSMWVCEEDFEEEALLAVKRGIDVEKDLSQCLHNKSCISTILKSAGGN